MNDLGPIFPGMVFKVEMPSGKLNLFEVEKSSRMGRHTLINITDCRYSGVHAGSEDLIPIPLTPEILRGWFGFELAGYSASYKIKGRVTVFVYNSDIHCWKIVIGGKGFEIKYVHQLQHWLASPGLGLNYKVDLTKTK